MPGLYAFGRRWSVGSDDFVFSSIIELLIKGPWVAAIAVIFAYHRTHLECPGGHLLVLFLIGVFVVNVVGLLLDVVIVTISTRGTVMDDRPRRHLPRYLYLRVFLCVPELAWVVLGSYWVFSDAVQCRDHPYTIAIVAGVVVVSWLILFGIGIGTWMFFDPLGKWEFDDETGGMVPVGNVHVHQTVWEGRFRTLLCCMYNRKDQSTVNTFKRIAETMSGLFTNADLVPSDVAAGFVLLHAGHRSFKKNSLAYVGTHAVPAYLTPILNMDMYNHDLVVNDPRPEAWMTVKFAAHYFKYAWGSYGWFYFLYLGCMRRMWLMRKTLRCFGCCRRPYYKEDNCCQCYVAALKVITGLQQEDILCLSMTNNVFETPYYVALDHASKSIVLTIRGTLSLHDVVTDLSAGSEEVVVPGIPEGTRSHSGILQAAKCLAARLEDSQILVDAKESHPDYHIVLLGHSLGAAVAAMLACILRPTFPDLRCYSYSGPGLLTPPAAKVTEEFVMSVVLGHDIVPRLCLASAHALRIRLIEALEQCRYPKHRILMTGCMGMCIGGMDPDYLLEPPPGSAARQRVADQPLLGSVSASSEASYTAPGSPQESIVDARLRVKRQQTMEECDYLILPGKILYIETRKILPDPAALAVAARRRSWRRRKLKEEYVARWARPEEFSEILVTPKMISQHMPANLHDAFDHLLTDAESHASTRLQSPQPSVVIT